MTQIPLPVLWNEEGELDLHRGSYVGRDRIVETLRSGAIQFCVANMGERLRWLESGEVYRFWKLEVEPRLVEPSRWERGVRREECPDERLYAASEWRCDGGEEVVVLLETHH